MLFTIAGEKLAAFQRPLKLLVMRLIAVLLTVACVNAHATGFTQILNFKGTSVPLEKIFEAIKVQTGYYVVCHYDLVRKSPPVTIDARNMPLETFMRQVLKDRALDFTIKARTIVISEVLPETINGSPSFDIALEKISGTVLNSQQQPLEGVTVTIKNIGRATQTDANGRFSIEVEEGQILVFSYVGYQSKEIKVDKTATSLTITLVAANRKMDDVVVVGYGTLRKQDFAGSSSSVGAKVIAETPPTTLENALQGRLAGVNITNTSAEPGGGVNIQVRGATSLSGGNQPLYVIDGVPQYNDNTRSSTEINGFAPTNALAALNPTDIESVEVLKDASSVSIYGSRGANGVILITTKKGKAGKGTVALNYYSTFAETPKTLPLATARQFAEHINLAGTNLGQPGYYDGTYKVTNNNQDSIYFPRPDELSTGTNWQKEIFRSAVTQNVQLMLSGGNESARYLVSGNFLADQGVVKFSKYRKGSIRANIDARVNDKLSLTINSSYSSDLNDRAESTNQSTTPGGLSPSGVILKSLIASPALPADNQAYRTYLLLQERGASSGLVNPLLDLQHTINQRHYAIFQSTMDLVYRFNSNFNFTVRGAYNNTLSGNDMYWGMLTELGYDRGQKTFQSTWKSTSYINENFLTFNKQADRFNLNVVAGTSVQTEVGRGNEVGGELLSVPSANGLYLLPLFQNRSIPITNYAKSFLVSGFGRMSFSYLDRYLLTLTGRGDASSKFAENKKWAFFPSIGLGWVFTEENFFNNGNGLLSNGKLRFSVGTSGNQAISPFQSLSSLSPISYGFLTGGVTGIVTNTSENKDLTWETTKQEDIGLDLAFWANRLHFTFDVYRKRTDNLLQYKSIPAESGYATILTNFGSIENKGIEAEIAATVMQGQQFTWDLSLNASVNRNKVIDLGEGVEFYNAGSGQADYTHRLRPGSPLGDFWGYKTDGLLTPKDISDGTPTLGGSTAVGDLKFVDINNDGKINDDDKTLLGNAMPKYTFGISNNFVYRNWTLNVFVMGMMGQEVLNQNLLYSTYGSYFGVPSQKYISDFWTPENTDAFYPRPSAGAVNNVTTDRLIEKASFVRIKTLSIRYNFSKVPVWLKKLQLYATANNLYTFTNYEGYDPEVSGYGQSILTPGIDVGSYPRTRMWTVGIDVQF